MDDNSNDNDSTSTTRRDVMRGVGGLAALSMSNTTIAQAQEVLEEALESDPHTVDTYRSIVDAILPETPALADEEGFGEEHVPGGLAVELEKFIIWDFNHFHEIRSGPLVPPGTTPGEGEMAPATFETAIDVAGADSELAALADSRGGLPAGLDVDLAAIDDHLDFGATERYEVAFADLDPGGEGVAEFDLEVQTSEETYHAVLQNYPYANAFPYAFDLVAAEFLARAENEDPPAPNEQFPAGGTFVRLSRRDRLRALWTIVDDGAVDRLDELLSPVVPHVGLLKFVVMAVNGLHGFGYYTEWSGYGDTKNDDPSERQLQVEEGEVQSRRQTGYPGPSDGYAADWRHAVPGGFTDEWDAEGGEGDGPPEEPPPDDAPAGVPDGVADVVEGDSP